MLRRNSSLQQKIDQPPLLKPLPTHASEIQRPYVTDYLTVPMMHERDSGINLIRFKFSNVAPLKLRKSSATCILPDVQEKIQISIKKLVVSVPGRKM